MKRDFTVIVERDVDGWYVADVPELPSCHTQARSLDELTERGREAIELCLEDTMVEPSALVGIQRISVEVRAPEGEAA